LYAHNKGRHPEALPVAGELFADPDRVAEQETVAREVIERVTPAIVRWQGLVLFPATVQHSLMIGVSRAGGRGARA
jgi:hypothetical protein